MTLEDNPTENSNRIGCHQENLTIREIVESEEPCVHHYRILENRGIRALLIRMRLLSG